MDGRIAVFYKCKRRSLLKTALKYLCMRRLKRVYPTHEYLPDFGNGTPLL